MDVIFPVLFGVLGLCIPILIIAGIVYFILKLRGGTSIRFSYRGALRVYFYVVFLISVGLLGVGGVSTLLKVGFGEIVDREFSYGEVYEEHRSMEIRKEECKLRGDDYCLDYSTDSDYSDRPLLEKVELAMKTSLINGVSLGIIGLFLALVHFYGRRWVEIEDTPADLLRRLYLMAGLTAFAVVTITSLASAIPETLKYALLDLNAGEVSPGDSLSIAIIAMPVWLFYLIATVKNMREASCKKV
jgi:hypothetical protein